MAQNPPSIVYVQAEDPPGVTPAFTDMKVTVGADPKNPFGEVEALLRDWFADHAWKGDIMGPDYMGEHAQLGPNQLLELQTNVFTPRRWLRLRIESHGTEHWMGLVLRGDNCYAKGFFNRFGQCQMTERQKKEDPRVRVRYLPKDYPHLSESWELNYTSFMGCSQARLLATMRDLIWSEDFVPKAIRFLSDFDPFMAEQTPEGQAQAKQILGGFVFRFIEFLRMELDFVDDSLVKKVQGWAPLSIALRHWKAGVYQAWVPNSTVIDMGLESLPMALRTCRLVLNDRERYPDADNTESIETLMFKDGIAKGRHGRRGKELAAQSSSIPCGQRTIQILRVWANFLIQGINIYDCNQGQSIYERSGSEDKVAGTVELKLHGPSRIISGENLIGAEIFYPVSQKFNEGFGGSENDSLQSVGASQSNNREESGGSEGDFMPALDVFNVQWSLLGGEEGPRSLNFRHFRHRMRIECLVLENALEAEVLVSLLLGKITGEVYLVSGSISVSSSEYRGKFVPIFSEGSLQLSSGGWTPVQLTVPVVSLSSRGANRELEIVVDLKVRKPSDPTYLREIKVARGNKIGTAKKLNVKIGEFELEAGFKTSPTP